MSVPQINTAISPALDPMTYQSVEGYDDSTRGYVDDIISLFNDTYATLGKLVGARKLADSNPAWTEEQRLAGRLDRTMRDLDARIEQVQGELARPVQQGAMAGPLASEVRSHFKSLNSPARLKLIREALAADDEATLQAVLGAQSFLSGMSAIDRDYFTILYHAKKAPHLVARLELMTRVRDLMDKNGANGTVFHRAFEKAVAAPPKQVSAIKTANRLAEEALKIEPAA
ncbi:hypothetical protein [uncultured Sphingomonas sp.]|uniref:hypothetical protein n=1 Tax=uncultured Sphingomonas sp. TaxID=158754 RepID=UPI0025DF42C9|nr:hypothetical protein [uncultured Sphingomonas sp.]